MVGTETAVIFEAGKERPRLLDHRYFLGTDEYRSELTERNKPKSTDMEKYMLLKNWWVY